LAIGLAGEAAAATTVTRSGNVVTITGGDEVNYVDQPGYGDTGPLLYSDPNGIYFGAGCVDAGTGNTVQCGNLGPGLVAQISLGGGDDTLRPDATLTTAPRLVVDLGPGNDTMWGSAHADEIDAGPGDDDVNGRGGNDVIDGGAGNDRLSGGAADDTITGGPGRDSLFGDGDFAIGYWGNDTLLARDGEIDALSCSVGADSAVADPLDTFDVRGDCERLDAGDSGGGGPSGGGGGGPSGGGGGGPSGGALSVSIDGAPKGTLRLKRLAAGRPLKFTASFSVPCSALAALRVSAREARRRKLAKRQVILAQFAAGVPEAGTYEAKLKVKRRYRAKLRRAKKVAATIKLSCTAPDGKTVRSTRKVTLR
jgi:hypothetical protein